MLAADIYDHLKLRAIFDCYIKNLQVTTVSGQMIMQVFIKLTYRPSETALFDSTETPLPTLTPFAERLWLTLPPDLTAAAVSQLPDISSVFPPEELCPPSEDEEDVSAGEDGAARPPVTPPPLLYQQRLQAVPPEAVSVPMIVSALVDQVYEDGMGDVWNK